MTREEAVAHKAQEQFDEYEREIAALRALLRLRPQDEPLDVERLKLAIAAMRKHPLVMVDDQMTADAIAREYAALTRKQPE